LISLYTCCARSSARFASTCLTCLFSNMCVYMYILSVCCLRWQLSHMSMIRYGVATIGRLLKMIGLFCQRALEKRRYSAKETYNFKEPTNHSHPICGCLYIYSLNVLPSLSNVSHICFQICAFTSIFCQYTPFVGGCLKYQICGCVYIYSLNVLPSLAVVSHICFQICVFMFTNMCVYIVYSVNALPSLAVVSHVCVCHMSVIK